MIQIPLDYLKNCNKIDKLWTSNAVGLYLLYYKEYTEFSEWFKGRTSIIDITKALLEVAQSQNLVKIIGNNLPEDIEWRQDFLKLLDIKENANEITEILEYLNKVTQRRFDVKSQANRKFIKGRLDQGYTAQDCKNVVDAMNNKWRSSTERFYLRPETLFNETKFQSYINFVDVNTTNSVSQTFL